MAVSDRGFEFERAGNMEEARRALVRARNCERWSALALLTDGCHRMNRGVWLRGLCGSAGIAAIIPRAATWSFRSPSLLSPPGDVASTDGLGSLRYGWRKYCGRFIDQERISATNSDCGVETT